MCNLGKVGKTTSEGSFKGFRSWNLKGKSLMSPSRGTVWKSASNTAKKPSAENQVGFNVMKTAAQARGSGGNGGSIYGEVVVSGTVVHYGKGYRAEKVKIISLSDAVLAAKYKVSYCGPAEKKAPARKDLKVPKAPKARKEVKQTEEVSVGV